MPVHVCVNFKLLDQYRHLYQCHSFLRKKYIGNTVIQLTCSVAIHLTSDPGVTLLQGSFLRGDLLCIG